MIHWAQLLKRVLGCVNPVFEQTDSMSNIAVGISTRLRYLALPQRPEEEVALAIRGQEEKGEGRGRRLRLRDCLRCQAQGIRSGEYQINRLTKVAGNTNFDRISDLFDSQALPHFTVRN